MLMCRHCGWENPEEAAFCTNCGRALARARGNTPEVADRSAQRFRALVSPVVTVRSSEPPATIDPPMPALSAPPQVTSTPTLLDFRMPEEMLVEIAKSRELRSTVTDGAVSSPKTEPSTDALGAIARALREGAQVPPGIDATAPAIQVQAPISEAPQAEASQPETPQVMPLPVLGAYDEFEDYEDEPSPGASVPSVSVPKGTPATSDEGVKDNAEGLPSVDLLPPDDDLPQLDESLNDGFTGLVPGESESEDDLTDESLEDGFTGQVPHESEDDFTDKSLDLDAVDVDELLEDADHNEDDEDEDEDEVMLDSSEYMALPSARPAIIEPVAIEPETIEPEAIEPVPIDSGPIEPVRAAPPPMPKPPPVPSQGYVLRCLTDDQTLTAPLSLGEAGLTVGRSDADLCLDQDPFVSPSHASFELGEETISVTDLESLNGTWLRVKHSTLLSSGTVFQVGHQLIRLEQTFATAEAELGEDTARLGANTADSGYQLVVMDAKGDVSQLHRMPPEGCRLGRHIADLVFTDDALMSATHAVLLLQEDGVHLSDLGSRNGTWVRIEGQQTLEVGDAVMVGRTVLRVGLAAS